MPSSKKAAENNMGGEQDSSFDFRVPSADKAEFVNACKVGTPRSKAVVMRALMKIYSDWTKLHGRQPDPVEEMFASPARRAKK